MRHLLLVLATVSVSACSFPRPADKSEDASIIDTPDEAIIDAPVDVAIDAPPSAMLTANRTDYNFGPTVLSTDSATAEFRITNTGELASGTLDPAVLGGTGPSQFRVVTDGCSGRVLNPTEECTVTAGFRPSAVGAQDATLTIQASPGGTIVITLGGTGAQAGALAISPQGFSFPNPVDAGSNTTQVFTVTNSGGVNTSALMTPALSGSSTMTITAEDCTGRILTPSGGAMPSCTVTVRFAPTAYGTQSGMLTTSATTGGTAQTSISGVGRQTFTLTVTNAGGGTVTSTPAGDINCGATCMKTYTVTTTAPSVSLTSTPTSGLSFNSYSGACTGTTCSLTMSQNRSVTAVFHAPLAVTINTGSNGNTGGGTVASVPAGFSCSTGTCNTSVAYGTTYTLRATPLQWALFTGWTGSCTNTSGDCVLTMTASRSVTAMLPYNCTPASPVGVIYVDSVMGTDDTAHGAGHAACAVKTFTYAKSRVTSSGVIWLTAGRTYTPGANGEGASPWTLDGTQELKCYSGTERITWNATDGNSTSNYLVQLSGTRNVLGSCVIDGQGRAGNGLRITTSGTGVGHWVQGNNFTSVGGLATHVLGTLTGITLRQNTFTACSTGIRYVGSNGGDVSSNTFTGTSTVDIACGNSSPSLTGAGNTRTGGVDCTTCSGCPF